MPEILFHIEFYLDSGSGKYEMELLNKTISLCRLFHEPRYELLFQIVYKQILLYSNFPTKCPIPKRPYEVRFSNTSSYSIDINNSFSSTLDADGSLDAEWIVSKNMPEMLYHIELYLDSGSGKYEMELLNKTINLCRLFREPRYEPLFQIIYKMILQYSNYPTKCPIPKRPYEVRFSNSSSYSIDINNSFSSTLNADGSLDTEWILTKNMPEMLFHIELYLDSGSGKYEMELLNKTINLCRLLREPRYEPLFQIVYKMILQYSNYPTKCPIPKRPYEVKILNISCYSIDENYRLNATTYADGSFDVDWIVLKTLPELFMHVELYMDSGSGKYEMELFNKTFNFCRFAREPRYEPLIQIIYKMVLLHSNYPTKCPVAK
ncbi:hypothetical protein Bhyg_05830, partial [Pseudolycoriella hygida]